MNDDSIQIEFTDEELAGNVVDNDPQNFMNNEGAGNDTKTTNQGSDGGTTTPPEGIQTQGQDGGDTEGAPAGTETGAGTQDGVLAQTDADLASAYGITEDEIRLLAIDNFESLTTVDELTRFVNNENQRYMKRVTYLAETHQREVEESLVSQERPYQTINRIFRQYGFDYFEMLNPFPIDGKRISPSSFP